MPNIRVPNPCILLQERIPPPQWYIHVEGKSDNLVCIISVTKVKCLLGEGTVIFPGEEPGNGKP